MVEMSYDLTRKVVIMQQSWKMWLHFMCQSGPLSLAQSHILFSKHAGISQKVGVKVLQLSHYTIVILVVVG